MKAETPTTLPDPADRAPGPGPGGIHGAGPPAPDAPAEARVEREFLDDMNHEFRTPWNAVIGRIGLVPGPDLTTDRRECLGVSTRSAGELDPAIPPVVVGDPGRLHLAVINLVDNASQRGTAHARTPPRATDHPIIPGVILDPGGPGRSVV